MNSISQKKKLGVCVLEKGRGILKNGVSFVGQGFSSFFAKCFPYFVIFLFGTLRIFLNIANNE